MGHAVEARKLGYFINNELKESKTTKYSKAYNPSTGEVIAKVPCCLREEVVQAAKIAFPGWSATPVAKGIQILYKLRDLLVEHMDELTYLVALEDGKTWKEAQDDVLKAKEGTEQVIVAPSLIQG